MMIASGDGSDQLPTDEPRDRLVNFSFPLTTFVPLTRGAEKHHEEDQTDDNQIVSFFSTFNGSNTSTVLNLNLQTTTTSGILDAKNQDNMVLIVGITCGVVGLLLGIIITAVFWAHKIRRQPRSLNRSRQASVFEKNPEEKTFEPLDLSLTLPRYETSHSALEYRHDTSTVSRFDTPMSTNEMFCSENNSCRSYDTLPSPSLNSRRFKKCRTFPNNGEIYEMKPVYMFQSSHLRDPNCFENATDHDAVSPQLQSRVYHENKSEWEKRLVSVSARGSFSSGLGTGTESDVYPCENKSVIFPLSKGVNDSIITCDPSTDQTLPMNHDELRERTRGHGFLTAVTESGEQRKDRSMPGYHKKRSARKSNASSSCASSRAPSIHDYSTADGPWNHSTELPSTSPFPRLHNSTIQDRDELTEVNDALEKLEVSSVKSSSEEAEKNRKKNDDMAENEVLSTYFDIRFPSLSLASTSSNAETKKVSADTPETHIQAIDVISDISDDTINL